MSWYASDKICLILTRCRAGTGLRRKIWLCSADGDPADPPTSGSATFTDSSENDNVLCRATLNALGDCQSKQPSEQARSLNKPIETVKTMENPPSDIETVRIRQNLCWRVLMKPQVHCDSDRHSNEVPTAEMGRVY